MYIADNDRSLQGERIWSNNLDDFTLCPSVDAEGGVALITLTGEICNQLTIADHQKQAATYETREMVNF